MVLGVSSSGFARRYRASPPEDGPTQHSAPEIGRGSPLLRLDATIRLTHDARPRRRKRRRTRRARIDPRLRACGWQVVPFDTRRPLTAYNSHAIEEYPTANGPANYALVVDGQLLGVVEAKKVTLGPQNVLTQAERYSKQLPGIRGAVSLFHER